VRKLQKLRLIATESRRAVNDAQTLDSLLSELGSPTTDRTCLVEQLIDRREARIDSLVHSDDNDDAQSLDGCMPNLNGNRIGTLNGHSFST
jgi:hypothetical protein